MVKLVAPTQSPAVPAEEKRADDVQNKAKTPQVLEDEDEVEEVEDRGQWSHQCDFLLSCIGYAVGLGNVWRFPYLCYVNGGGAFLIPYVIMLLFAGVPIFFMELVIGQYASLGPGKVFGKMCPLLQGVGYAMLFVTFLVAIYYNVIIGWTLYYFYATFFSDPGWGDCGHDFNTKDCYTPAREYDCLNKSAHTQIYFNNSCFPIDEFCTTHELLPLNNSHCKNPSETAFPLKNVGERIHSSEDFFRNYVLYTRDATWYDFGDMRWQLVLCLLLAWLVVALCSIKGVKSSGKVVYFTATFPYIILIILCVRGATLDGALEGIQFYIIPDFSRLKNAKVWADAATQIFFSLGLSFGVLISLASYNKFHSNCLRDSLIVSFCNCLTSIFAGFVIFSILGFMAKKSNMSVGEVVASGLGLTFIAYPEAFTKMPISNLWANLFFFMLITLGLDSQFTMVETLTTAFFDQFPRYRSKKSWIILGVCLVGFILGLVFCTQGGIYMFTLFDWYSAGWSLLLVSLAEVTLVSWIFGFDRLMTNVEDEMEIWVPTVVKLYLKICWKFVTPILLTAIFFFSLYNYTPAYYSNYQFPWWANMIGWFMAFGSVLLIPVFAVYRIKTRRGSIRKLLRPTRDWAPAILRRSLSRAPVRGRDATSTD